MMRAALGGRCPAFQLANDTTCRYSNAASVLPRPNDQPLGELADVVSSLQQGLAQLHGLREVVVHEPVRLTRVDVQNPVGILPLDIAIPPALHRKPQKIPRRKPQHHPACAVGQPFLTSDDAAQHSRDVRCTSNNVWIVHNYSRNIQLSCPSLLRESTYSPHE